MQQFKIAMEECATGCWRVYLQEAIDGAVLYTQNYKKRTTKEAAYADFILLQTRLAKSFKRQWETCLPGNISALFEPLHDWVPNKEEL